MVLLNANIKLDNRNLGSIINSKVLQHSFDFPYEGDVNNLIETGQCTISDPPGLEFVPASTLDVDLFEYPYNLLIPNTYNTVVLFEENNTVDLEVGDLLAVNDTFYEMVQDVPQGMTIPNSAILDVTDQVIAVRKEVSIMTIPGVGYYNVPTGHFCPVVDVGDIEAAKVEFIYDGEPIYSKLPIDTYNLGELEDRDIVILESETELAQNSIYYPIGQNVYISTTGKYFTVLDGVGTYEERTDGLALVSATRYLMKGADAGIDYLTQETNDFFTKQINPLTCDISNLEWVSQIFGLDGIARGEIYSENFKSIVGDQNPLSETELRTLLNNALGWSRPLDPDFNGVIQLHDPSLVSRVDFIFNGSNNAILSPGDKGVFIDNDIEQYEVIEPTDESQVTLENMITGEEVSVSSGSRLSGVIYDRSVFLNRKGRAMSPFVDNIPEVSREEIFNFQISPGTIVTPIEYRDWIENPFEIDLVVGETYKLVDSFGITDENGDLIVDINNVLELNTGFSDLSIPFGDIQQGDNINEILFTVNPELDPDIENDYIWEDFIQLKFTISELDVLIEPERFDPVNWRGVVGTRGSRFGITVGNTIIGIENKVPTVTADGFTVTRVVNDVEFQKAKRLDNYLGSPRIFTHVQYDEVSSDLSFSDDFWFIERETPRALPYFNDRQYLYYPITDQLLTFKVGEEVLRINGNNTTKEFPIGSVFMTDSVFLYYWDPFTKELYKTQEENPLSTFVLRDWSVEQVNCSHGYYIVPSGNTDIPWLVKKDRKVVYRISQQDINNIRLFKDYPWLGINNGVNSTTTYIDLLNVHSPFTGDGFFPLSTCDGSIIYDNNGEFFLTQSTSTSVLVSPGQIDIGSDTVVRIEPDYSDSKYYDFLEKDFTFYQVLLDDGGGNLSTKFIYSDSIRYVDTANLVKLGSKISIEGQDLDPFFSVYF